MSAGTTHVFDNGNDGHCYECGADVPNITGSYYCAECVAKQLRDEQDERTAFDAYHAFADACAKRSR